jgi:hypothetical protein
VLGKATLKVLSVATALGPLPFGKLAAQEAYPVQASIRYSPQTSGSDRSFYNRFCNNGDMYLGFARDKSDLAQKVASFCDARKPEDWVGTFPQGVTLVVSLTSKGGSPDKIAAGQATFQSMNTVDYEPNKSDAFQKQWHETGYGFALTMCTARDGDDLSEQFAKSGGQIAEKVKDFCETFLRMSQDYAGIRQQLMDRNPEAALGRPANNFEELKKNRFLSDALDDAKDDYIASVQNVFAAGFPEGITGHFAVLPSSASR